MINISTLRRNVGVTVNSAKFETLYIVFTAAMLQAETMKQFCMKKILFPRGEKMYCFCPPSW